MKKIIIASASFLILAVAAYFLFFNSNGNTKTIWTAVPDQAVAVIEISDVDDWWYDHEESNTLLPLINSDFFKPVKSLIELTEKSLKRKGYGVFDITGDKEIAVVITKSSNGLTSSLLVPEVDSDADYIAALIEGVKNEFGTGEIEEKISSGLKYLALKSKKDAFYIHRSSGLICLSFTDEGMVSMLRGISNTSKESSILLKKKMHEETEVNTEYINVYLNPVMLFQAVNPLMKDASKSFIHALEHFADNAFLDIKFDDEAVYFNGFTHDSDTAFTFANCLKSQNPIPFSLKDYLPNRTLSFAYLGISDGSLFKHNLEEYSWSSDKPLQEGWSVLHKTFQINVDEVYKEIRGEVVLVEVLNRLKTIDKLVFIKPVSIEKAREQYKNMALGVLNQDQELESESFKDVQISLLGEFDFPGKVFGSYFSGFEATYYAAIGDYIVLSESPQPIKGLVNDMEDDEVWSRSLEKNFLVERYFTDANFGFYVDLKQAITWLDSNLSTNGKKSLKGMEDFLSQIGMFSIQITNENEKLFTSMISVIEGNDGKGSLEEIVVEETIEDAEVKSELFFENSLVTKPIIVKNHIDKSLEVLVADSANKIHLVSSSGELLWSYDLEGQLVSKVHQVDVYKNHKLQYLFATNAKVYCIDRKGNDVDGYPYKMEAGSGVINNLSVIDYEGQRDYRIAVSSDDGYLVLANIEGDVLDGWNPKRFQSALIQPLEHSRVRGRDFMLTSEANTLHVFKRNGEYYDGFPKKVDGSIGGKWFVNEGPSFRKSNVALVVDECKVIEVNYNGKEELKYDYRNLSKEPKVTMKASAGGEQNVFLLNPSPGQWIVQDDKNQELFKIDLEDYVDLELQYYPIKKKELFVLISKERNQIFIYNKAGKLVGGETLDGGEEIALLYLSNKNVYKVYVVNRKSLRVLEIKAD